MKFLLPVLLAVTLTAPVAAQSKPLGKVRFELIDNRIFVNVTINGQGPFHMILDTGANLAVSPQVAQKAGLKVEQSGTTGGVGEKQVEFQQTHVRELSFGPVQLSNLECGILSTDDSPYVFGKIPVDGFLGLEVFQKYVVSHDYLKRELTFYSPESYSYSGPGESIPFERRENIPIITAAFDGVPSRFGVDTGARSALILYGPYAEERHLMQAYQPKFLGVSGWGIGGPVRSYMVRSKSLKIGGTELKGMVARLSVNKSGATAGSDQAGLIGPDVLKQFTFICDYARQRLIFEKNSQFGLRDSYDRAGVWISQKGDAFEVFDVIPGGPADQAGLKVGDRITAINGESTAQLTLTQVRDSWKYGDSGTAIHLLIEAANHRKRSAKMILRDLV
jgi:predicted aspartyl protease